MKRSTWDLKIKTSRTPLPSIEIQVKEEEQWTTVFENVEKVLTAYAENNPDMIATVYMY